HDAYNGELVNDAIFLFGQIDERFATPALIQLSREAKGEVKEIATSLLMSQATPEALRAVANVNERGLSPSTVASIKALQSRPALIEPRTSPRTPRAEFLAAFAALMSGNEAPFDHLVESVPDGERDLVAVSRETDVEIIR